jgi:phosphatidylinositol-3-phosphatase
MSTPPGGDRQTPHPISTLLGSEQPAATPSGSEQPVSAQPQTPPTSPLAPAEQSRAELERRREELAGRVAELHWDLGGLAYEMAIRDHFRNDVLLQRAAQLQELDTELAEVERRLGDARAQDEGPGGTRGAWARVLPPAQICALLLIVFLGFGAAVGAAAKGSRTSRPRAREVLVAEAPAATSSGTSSTAQVSPPAAKAEATPSPAAEGEAAAENTATTPATPAAKTGTASTPSPSGAAGGGSSGAKKGAASGGGGGGGSVTKLPAVKHVFVVMLDDEPYATVFGPASPAHYLTGTLEKKGELLVRYYAVAHEQLANGIALLSGQGPTPQTAQNCPTYENVTPGTVGAEGQVSGSGCVYPSATQTLAGQLTAKHLTWKAYLEGMDEGSGAAGSATEACGRPTLGAADPTSALTPPVGQAYATWRNPFVYFHSVIDSPECASDDVGLSSLKGDLASAKSTPNFSYIVPGRCDDGDTTPCAAGQTGGMAAADGFLQQVVPEILGSKAYKENGLLVITIDEAPSSGEYADSSSCCGQPSFPNLPAPAGAIGKPGGGQVGALLLSPFIKGGNLEQGTYNHFSLLRTVEDFFGLAHLGYAGGSGVSSFSPSLFTAAK